MALKTDPSAAPVTVPMAPKNDPSTALVAAAPAPAITLLTVRSTLRAGCSALRGLPVGPLPGGLGTGGRGGRADRDGVGWDGTAVLGHWLLFTITIRQRRSIDV